MQAIPFQGFALSAQQTHLWRSADDAQTYRTIGALQIQGTLKREVLKQAVQQAVMRNEILRTVFASLPGMDLPLQVIREQELWLYTEVNLQQLTRDAQCWTMEVLFTSLQQETFDLEQGPIVCVRLCRFQADLHVMFLSLPALCADPPSWKLLVEEILAYYDNQPLEEALQYADVSAWQEEELEAPEAELQREYWRKKGFCSQDDRLPLPLLDGGAAEAQDKIGGQVIDIELAELAALQVQAQASALETSVSAWLLTCLQVLLWRLGRGANFAVGVACDGRPYQELQQALGPYMRFVPIEARLEPGRSFAWGVAATQALLQEAQQLQLHFCGEGLDEASSNKPIFPIAFEYETWPATLQAGELSCSVLKRYSYTEPFLLKLSVLQRGTRLHLELDYDAQQVTRQQAETIGRLFETLLEQVTADPQTRLGALRLLDKGQHEALLLHSQGPQRAWAGQRLHQLFEAQVRTWPDALAAVSPQEQWTYSQLNEQANRLARVLQQRGVGANRVVGLCLTRQASMLVGLLGVLKAGGAYLPLEASNPAARTLHQLQESGALILLVQEDGREQLPAWSGQTLVLEELAPELVEASPEDLTTGVGGELAAVIYTSGSTGKPKGVMVRQSSVVNYTLALCEQLGARPGWHYTTVSTLAADLGNTAIFCALASGGCLQVLDYQTVTSTEAMAAWARQHPIDVLKIVPSHISALLESVQAHEFLPREALILGGEALSTELVTCLRQAGATCQLYNHYGPTETTIGVLVNPIELQTEGRWSATHTLALGRPLANMQVYVMDPWMQLVPPGFLGELYIGGAGLAWGYIGQAGQTAERFVSDPWSREAGSRLYRTGDLMRYGKDGQIEFVGRTDGQIKLRGYRVEVGEIEATLRGHALVRQSIVLLHNQPPEAARLVGYIVSQKREPIPAEQLDAWIRARLPDYMVPREFIHLEAWPLTANGKVDRSRLLQMQQASRTSVHKGREARSPIEESLLEIWRDVVGLTNIDIHDNFFAVGGHSLLAMQVMARMQAILQVDLPVRAIFEAPTVAGLAHYVEQALHGGEEIAMPPLVAGERPSELPLSFAQQRLWFLDQLEPGNTAYLASRSLKITGPLEVAYLEQSLRTLVGRHESLRTTFALHGSQPVQIIAPLANIALPVIHVQGLQAEQQAEIMQQLIAQEAQHACDLARGPLLRTWLIRLDPQEHVLILTLHHIITDGWSNEVLTRELATLYQGYIDNISPALPPLPIQYADYALWQRGWLREERLSKQLAYWRRQLADFSPLELWTDYPRSAASSYHGAQHSLSWPEALGEQINALSQQADATIFMVLLAAFQVLLMHYTGKTDISVGTPIANRTRTEIENLIGFFVNTLILRTDLSGNPTFLQVVKRVREVCLESYAHQDVPFEQVVEMLQMGRDVQRLAPLTVSFQYTQEQALPPQLAGLELAVPGSDGASADYDLRVQLSGTQHSLCCTVFYNINLFAAATIERLQAHFQTLMQAIVNTPEAPIGQLALLSEQERRRQLETWNATDRDFPQGITAHGLFEQQAERTPDAIALALEDQQVSYACLNRRANQLARYLQKRGVGPETLVGLCLERSLEMVVGLLGVLKAGGAYVPLNPTYPAERLAWQIADTQIALLLTQQQIVSGLLPREPGLTINLQSDWSSIVAESDDTPQTGVVPENLAYVIYTSGSTGQPKGVMITHKSLSNYLLWRQETYHLYEWDRVVQKTALSFDVSVWEFFWPLMSGARLILAHPGGQQDPAYLRALIVEQQVTTMHFGPAMLQAFLQEPDLHACSSLRQVMCGGEALSIDLQASFFASLPAHVHLYNLYGPTETTINVTYWACQRESRDERVPIGRPIANTQIYVLDRELQPVPIGVPGELYVGGENLARGYLKRADVTAERFVPHPFSMIGGERLYQTGDLAHYRADGNIEYLGRLDQQVKLRGYRIELGEIEATLRGQEAVQEAVVLRQEDRPGSPYLAAYITLRRPDRAQPIEGTPIEERFRRWQREEEKRLLALQLRQYLAERLPDYMVPARLEILHELPLTAHGKVDRKALPTAGLVLQQEYTEQDGPRTPIEELVGNLWSEVLGHERVGIHESFFELGGHSLLVTQVVARMRATLGIEIPVRVAFEAPTIAGMARWVERALRTREAIELPPLTAIAWPEHIPLSFAQQRLWFLQQLNPNSTVYLSSGTFRLRGILNSKALERSIQEIVRRHENLRTTFTIRAEQPVQIIHVPERFVLPMIDLRELGPERRTQEAQVLADQAAQQPCNLVTGPLFRVQLLQLEAQEYAMHLTLHHIITDGWSSEVLVRELSAFYQAYRVEQAPPLPPLPIQYAHYALWQRQWLQGEVLQNHIAYWQEQLRGVLPLELPTDASDTAVPHDRGARYTFELSKELSANLVALSRSEGVTLFMTLLAAFQILLYRISGQADIVVGTDVANRTQVETEGLIGFFINLLALRTQLQGAPSFREVLKQVRATVLEAYAHQELPFELVVEHVQTKRTTGQTPIIQVLCVMQNTPRNVLSLPDIEFEVLDPANPAARFDLALFLQEGTRWIRGSVVYRAGLFRAQTIAAWMHQFDVLLHSIVAEPDTVIEMLSLYTNQEKVEQTKEKAVKNHLEAKRINATKNRGFEIGELKGNNN